MLPDMHAALHAARAAALRCTDAAHEGDARALQEAAAQAEQAQGIAVRMAAAVAPHWVRSALPNATFFPFLFLLVKSILSDYMYGVAGTGHCCAHGGSGGTPPGKGYCAAECCACIF